MNTETLGEGKVRAHRREIGIAERFAAGCEENLAIGFDGHMAFVESDFIGLLAPEVAALARKEERRGLCALVAQQVGAVDGFAVEGHLLRVTDQPSPPAFTGVKIKFQHRFYRLAIMLLILASVQALPRICMTV